MDDLGVLESGNIAIVVDSFGVEWARGDKSNVMGLKAKAMMKRLKKEERKKYAETFSR